MDMTNSNVIEVVGEMVFNISKSVAILNAEEAVRRLPVVIFISILIIIGVFGNLHVLYIYYSKFSVSTYRLFVLSLASIDIISCCVSMPFEMVDELNPYIFEAVIACKIFRFINTCLAMATGLMLVVIASERYRRICKPYGSQMTEKQSRYWLASVVCFAMLASSPALYVYGRKTIDIPGSDLKGSECTWSDSVEGEIIGYVYYAWGLLVIIICMVLLVILYSLVGTHLRKHTIKVQSTIRIRRHRRHSTKRRRRSFGSRIGRMKTRMTRSVGDKILDENVADDQTKERQSTQSSPQEGRYSRYNLIDENYRLGTFRKFSTEIKMNKAIIKAILSVNDDCDPKNSNEAGEKDKRYNDNTDTSNNNTSELPTWNSKDSLSENITEQPERQSEVPLVSVHNGQNENVNSNDKKVGPEAEVKSRRTGTIMQKTKTFINEREQRITKVLFTITLLFIFSFLPYIVILIVYSADETYGENLSPSANVVYLMCLRLYLINNVVNSLLYISFDFKFRKHFLGIYKKWL